MINDNIKLLLPILKWQALVVISQGNDKMNAINWGIFYNFGCSDRDYVEALTFVRRLEKMWRTSKHLKK